MIRMVLREAPPSAEVVAEGRRRIAAGGRARQRPRLRWGLAGAGLTAAVAGGLAAAVVLASTTGAPGQGGQGTRGQGTGGHRVSFAPATSAAAVLRNAALAALQIPPGAPAPGQFVYTKLYRYDQSTGAAVVETWLSADGTRLGLQQMPGGRQRAPLPACRNGFWYLQPAGRRPFLTRQRCSAAANAAYLPGLPTGTAALRRYLDRHLGLDPADSGGLLTNIETMMTTGYLTPAQRAALYRVLAGTPGLTVVPQVTNMRGATGVGIRSGRFKTSVYTIIFSRKTYAPLGMNWTGVAWPEKGNHGGEVLLRTAIVNRAGQLP